MCFCKGVAEQPHVEYQHSVRYQKTQDAILNFERSIYIAFNFGQNVYNGPSPYFQLNRMLKSERMEPEVWEVTQCLYPTLSLKLFECSTRQKMTQSKKFS